MFTIIVVVLLLIEHKKGQLWADDFKYALGFMMIDVVDFTIAYLLFT